MIKWSLILAFIVLSICSSAVAQNAPSQPPEQLKWCSLMKKMMDDQVRYDSLDSFAKQSATKPAQATYVKEAFDLLGPSGTFTNWIGILKISTTDVPGKASLTFLACNGTIFETAPKGSQRVESYPGSGLLSFTSPTAAALIAIPAHSSTAMVSGHLFALKGSAADYVSWRGDGDLPLGRPGRANPGSFNGEPYLAAFTHVTLPKH